MGVYLVSGDKVLASWTTHCFGFLIRLFVVRQDLLKPSTHRVANTGLQFLFLLPWPSACALEGGVLVWNHSFLHLCVCARMHVREYALPCMFVGHRTSWHLGLETQEQT